MFPHSRPCCSPPACANRYLVGHGDIQTVRQFLFSKEKKILGVLEAQINWNEVLIFGKNIFRVLEAQTN